MAVLGLTLFFGYAAYKDWIFDSAAVAEEKIHSALTVHAATSSQPEASKNPEYYGLKRAEIALAEFRKNVVETKHGCNCGPEIEKYTEGNHAQWCTMFASWVTYAAGSPVMNEKTESWRITNSREFAKYLQTKGTWYPRQQVIDEKIEPRIGDFIVFWRGKFEDNLGHVDVVVEKGAVLGTAGLVGGNLKDRVQFRESFPYLQHYGFLGIGRPEK